MSDTMGYPVLPLEKRPIQRDIDVQYEQTSIDTKTVRWQVKRGALRTIVYAWGQDLTLTALDTQRLRRFLVACQEDTDREAAVEQQSLDAGAIR